MAVLVAVVVGLLLAVDSVVSVRLNAMMFVSAGVRKDCQDNELRDRVSGSKPNENACE